MLHLPGLANLHIHPLTSNSGRKNTLKKCSNKPLVA
jgi:hypothetical protein